MLLGHRQLSDASLNYFISFFRFPLSFVTLDVSLNSSLFILSLPAQYFGYFNIVTWLFDKTFSYSEFN